MKNYDDLLNQVNEKEAESFLKKTKADFEITTNTQRVELDYSWVLKFEEYLPYIETIVRNPRQFIIQEDAILVVEKTKKVNKDTIKHLAQHSNFIQDIDDEGMVSPSKLLNAYKEDTYDIYENRFIKTLLTRLVSFLESQLKYQKNDNHITKTRKVSFAADTLQIEENVNINLSIETNSYKPLNINVTDYQARIKKINKTLEEFMITPFIKSLAMASPVASPINRTNLILGDQNFRKCLELWEFLDRYEHETIVKVTNTSEVDKSIDKKNLYLMNYFLDYQTIYFTKDINNKNKYELHLQKSIEECLEDLDWTDREYCRLVDTKIKEVRKAQLRRKNEIRSCYQDFIETEENRFKNAIEYLNA